MGPPLSPGVCAERLLQLFKHHLPVFTGGTFGGAFAPDFDASKLASPPAASGRAASGASGQQETSHAQGRSNRHG
jgi:hypothetical protein